ncbi:MAG: kynureninase [Candidatus Neomarinimicrobiota bacterium]|nr:kynureninase [Candidatus Neomarinimicrobiota bacterium]
MDRKDPLRKYRSRFHIPHRNNKDVIYFCGNSLGLMPKTTEEYLNRELAVWKRDGVLGNHTRWEPYHENVTQSTARLVGAHPREVVVMNALTVNIHLLLVSFYQPTENKFKIIIEKGAFPSDRYAVESQIKFHGFDPDIALVELEPRSGERCLRTDDIVNMLREHGNDVATILIGGVNYNTGQAFEMDTITKIGRKYGAKVGFDLAHAVGNLPLSLHEWNVDFAAWCSYKYLCAGPGSPGGIFIHERHDSWNGPRFNGWWGHDKNIRFNMGPDFIPIKGAEGWQISNAPILGLACLRSSMEIINDIGMLALRTKSEELTAYMEYLLNQLSDSLKIITPSDPAQRGCQLSVVMNNSGKQVYEKLKAKNVICDWREPDVIRLAPKPLYNSFSEVYQFVEILRSILQTR